ncbi:hypothetical protein ACJMK2_011609 [Sinanodonta woodiana]|uniref:Replication protein A 70 kDa DNA-binding subunit n=1 Tax=Sinanodonta woodiana TaxID=1069815 RepID=A0ABD3V8M8_SINWO
MGSSLWENGREEFEVKFHVQVLQKCHTELVKNLDVDLVLDYMASKEIIHPVTMRDIRELKITSVMTRELIQYLMKRDDQFYQKFKECLEESGQQHLKKHLENVEKNTEVKESEDASCDRSSQTNSVNTEMKSSKRPVNTISSLSKGSTDWTLLVRVISKSNIFRKRKMDGRYYKIIKYFSVFFRDESGEIRGVFFKDSVKNFEQFYDLLQIKQVFYVSGASVTETNPLYDRAYLELKINNKTTIEPCRVGVDIPIIGEYRFTKINGLRYRQNDEFVDVIGVVDSIGEIETIPTKYKKEETKRELNLVDQSGMVVTVTFWGRHARSIGVKLKKIIALLRVKVSDWRGLSLSMQASTLMHIEPDIQETHLLRKWYDDIGNGKVFTMVFR